MDVDAIVFAVSYCPSRNLLSRFTQSILLTWLVLLSRPGYALHSRRIEPDGQRPKVLLHGKACRKTSNPKCSLEATDTSAGIKGMVYALDVSQLMGDKMPLCKETDFEKWTVPADDRTPRCLLGRNLVWRVPKYLLDR